VVIRLLAAASVLWLARAASAAPFELAPPEQALTVAFAEQDGARQAFLVVSASEDAIDAVALGAGDAFAALAARSPDETAQLLRDGPRMRLALAELLPVIESAQNLAGGGNYAKRGAPFLFAKLAAPTPWQGRLAAQPDWLLDYEVEIALVFDRDLASAADLEATHAGVFLVNDFTEHAQLMREGDRSQPGVGLGFANAKSKPGFLPTGPFLVIPRDFRAFVRGCEIRLHVNGAERQRASGGQMKWGPDELVRHSLALAPQPQLAGDPLGALTAHGIRRGTALLTGTPAGVAFRPPDAAFGAKSRALWVLTLGFLREEADAFAMRSWAEEMRSRKVFLRGGDVVIAEGAGLGTIVTHIEAGAR
jgi:2-keto-4-pentenoate hydratase/2-oxohepta-3-ene-1,7-dioic acid hydratase in catechol pathway